MKKNRLLQVVIGIHALFLIICLITYKSDFLPKKKTRLIVRSHIQSLPPSQVKTQVVKSAPARKQPVKQPAPKPKPQPAKKAPTKPKPAPPPPPPPKPAAQEEKKKILADLQKSLEKIETKKSQPKAVSIAPPEQITTLLIDHPEEIVAEPHYGELLIAHLQRSLTLPELGEVKIKLTLDQEGKISSLEVLKCTSEVNKLYLEKELPRQILPPLEKKKMESYILTFCNHDT